MYLNHIFLSDFNSFFELLIAFAFAYGGLDGFKNYINKVSFRDYNIIYEEELSNTIEAIEKVSTPKLLTHLKTKIEALRSESEKIAHIEKIALGFYDGTFFQPMFFSVGLIYFFFLILGGFQNNMSSIILYIAIFLISSGSIIYNIIVLLRLRWHAIKLISLDNKWWLRSSTVLTLFFTLCVLSIIVAALINFYFTDKIDPFTQGFCFAGSFCECDKIVLIESIGIIFTMFLSFFPYFMYYFRSFFFLKTLESRFNTGKKNAEIRLLELKELVEAVHEYQIIKVKDKP